MLERSFILLPGIGPTRERALWRHGVEDWETYIDAAPGTLPGVPQNMQRHHQPILAAARDALAAQEATWFGPMLGTREAWRSLSEFFDGGVFLDIETTGLGRGDDHTTVCGMHSPRHGTELLVHGDTLTAEAVQTSLDRATCIVTFNGASFDLPFLQADLDIEIPRVPHVDLMLALRRVGLRGGLKRIETQLGLARPGDVKGLDGYQAVLLWQKHLRGRSGALEKLLAYNREDVENLVPLAREAYARLWHMARTGSAPEAPVASS